jgi:hypothetical protein
VQNVKPEIRLTLARDGFMVVEIPAAVFSPETERPRERTPTPGGGIGVQQTPLGRGKTVPPGRE